MSKAKEAVMRLIQKKQNAIRNHRDKHGRHIDVYHIVADFIRDVDTAQANSKDHAQFSEMLGLAADKMQNSFNKIDKDVFIDVAWNEATTWQDLKIDHISLLWSEAFSTKTGKNQQEVVDVTHLFLEGYFN